MIRFAFVVVVVAAAVYAGFWLLEQRRSGEPLRRPKPRDPRRPVAPDDDEDFLRGLRKRRSDPGSGPDRS